MKQNSGVAIFHFLQAVHKLFFATCARKECNACKKHMFLTQVAKSISMYRLFGDVRLSASSDLQHRTVKYVRYFK